MSNKFNAIWKDQVDESANNYTNRSRASIMYPLMVYTSEQLVCEMSAKLGWSEPEILIHACTTDS